ncbi:MAG: site-specific integrase [Chloroflexi bacterium]|nr:site-specific integrase [Chloroflexota bacterium]
MNAPSPDSTVAAYLDWWASTHVARLRTNTRENYLKGVELYRPELGSVLMRDLGPQHLQRIVDAQVEEAHYCPNTIRLFFGVIRSALRRAAVEHRLLEYNPAPMVRLPSRNPVRSKAFGRDDAVAFINEALAPDGTGGRHYHGVMLTTAIKTGMRFGELRGLRIDNLELRDAPTGSLGGIVRICEQIASNVSRAEWSEPKTVASHREIPVSPDLAGILRRHLERLAIQRRRVGTRKWQDNQLVFPALRGGLVMSKDLAWARRTIALSAGLSRIPTMHCLRHTYATQLANGRIRPEALQEVVGHADIRTTMNVYYDATEETLEEVAAAVADWSREGLDNRPRAGYNGLRPNG